MKARQKKKQKSLEQIYVEVMKSFNHKITPPIPTQEWTKPSDVFTKFSLYSDYPKSIASTESGAVI